MKPQVLILLLLASLSCGTAAVSAQSASPVAATRVQSDWLVTSEWLSEHLTDPNLEVVALTSVEEFEQAHIPGASQIDWPDLEIVDTTDASLREWQPQVEELLTQLGIERDDSVVVYDGGTFYAARLWWILTLLGHEGVRILNGGLPDWTDSGQELERGKAESRPAVKTYEGERSETVIASIDDVMALHGQPGVVFVDARTADEYAEGHIPGAINIPFLENAVAEGPKYWKLQEELLALYAASSVTPAMTVIPYCTTGVRSAVTYFTLRLIGFEDVALFSGSFAEWSNDPTRPVTLGNQP